MNNNSILVLSVILLLILLGCNNQDLNTITNNAIRSLNESKNYVTNMIQNESKQVDLKSDLAKNIAQPIVDNNLQKINFSKVQSHEDFKKMIDNMNFLISIYNDKAGTNMRLLSKESDAYSNFQREVSRYTPLVENYNSFIDSCYKLDCTSEESVDNLLKKAISFTVESVLIAGGVFHKAVFSAIGKFSNTFGLTSFSRVCPTCVSTVMSGGYWTTKNYLVNTAGSLSENIVS
jgi:hypothetical protein